MDITFVNVGYGDAILINENDFICLIDGGSYQSKEFDGFSNRIRCIDFLNKMNVKHIDLLIISHIHEDHICGLVDIVKDFSVGEIKIPYLPSIFTDSIDFNTHDLPTSIDLFIDAINAMTKIVKYSLQNNIKISKLKQGSTIHISENLQITALLPSENKLVYFEKLLSDIMVEPTGDLLIEADKKSNHNSLLLRADYLQISCLFAGDNCPQNWIFKDESSLKNVKILKLPHHGQPDSIDIQLFEQMQLSHLITSSSSDRRYNSSALEVYDAVYNMNNDINIIFTDEINYPPYFSNPEGANAIRLKIISDDIYTEFIK